MQPLKHPGDQPTRMRQQIVTAESTNTICDMLINQKNYRLFFVKTFHPTSKQKSQTWLWGENSEIMSVNIHVKQS